MIKELWRWLMGPTPFPETQPPDFQDAQFPDSETEPAGHWEPPADPLEQ